MWFQWARVVGLCMWELGYVLGVSIHRRAMDGLPNSKGNERNKQTIIFKANAFYAENFQQYSCVCMFVCMCVISLVTTQQELKTSNIFSVLFVMFFHHFYLNTRKHLLVKAAVFIFIHSGRSICLYIFFGICFLFCLLCFSTKAGSKAICPNHIHWC